MAKRRVDWSRGALMDLVEIINYYNNRNKSKIYSNKLNREIRYKLKTIDFTIALLKKRSSRIYFILLTIIFLFALKF